MREELLLRLVDDKSRPLIDVLSLLRVPVHRKMLESISDVQSFQAAEEAGLLYNISDRLYDDLIKGIGAFRKYIKELKI